MYIIYSLIILRLADELDLTEEPARYTDYSGDTDFIVDYIDSKGFIKDVEFSDDLVKINFIKKPKETLGFRKLREEIFEEFDYCTSCITNNTCFTVANKIELCYNE